MTETETVTEPTIDELVAQWEELRKQFPSPTWEEVMPEWKWIRGLMGSGTFDPGNHYAGRWIAVYRQQIIGQGINPLLLEVTKARELGIHPERLVLTYVNEVL